jgi:hypothetical protein
LVNDSKNYYAAVNESMDDIYSLDWTEDSENGDDNHVASSLAGHRGGDILDLELDSIIAQALDPKHTREYYDFGRKKPSNQSHLNRIVNQIYFKLVPAGIEEDPLVKEIGASLKVDSFDLSVDMVKRMLSKDPYIVQQLGLLTAVKPHHPGLHFGTIKPFVLGQMNDNKFEPLAIDASLQQCGVKVRHLIEFLYATIERNYPPRKNVILIGATQLQKSRIEIFYTSSLCMLHRKMRHQLTKAFLHEVQVRIGSI